MSLNDLKRVLQSSGLPEGRVFCDGIVDLEDGDALRLIPTAVRLLTERASHGDWSLRSSWLSHLGKGYQNIPGVSRAPQASVYVRVLFTCQKYSYTNI